MHVLTRSPCNLSFCVECDTVSLCVECDTVSLSECVVSERHCLSGNHAISLFPGSGSPSFSLDLCLSTSPVSACMLMSDLCSHCVSPAGCLVCHLTVFASFNHSRANKQSQSSPSVSMVYLHGASLSLPHAVLFIAVPLFLHSLARTCLFLQSLHVCSLSFHLLSLPFSSLVSSGGLVGSPCVP